MQKSGYPYEHMDDWKKFNETSLTEKKRFLQSLKYGNITDADYMHAKDCKDFEKT